MTTTETTSPAAFLRALIPERDIRRAARKVGFLHRVRKIDPVEFLFVVVMSVCIRQGQGIAEMRRSLAIRTGVELVRSAFWRRFSASFEDLVTWLLDTLVQRATEQRPKLGGLLTGFRDVVAVDGSVIVVDDRLAELWPGTRTNSAKAAVKLHTRVRATTGELLSYAITAETCSELGELHVAEADKGTLFLMDRGYASTRLWWEIERCGAYFLTRLKANFNPTILSPNRRHRGRSKKLAGHKLRSALNGLRRQYLDVQAEFIVRQGPQKGTSIPLRVVGVWDRRERKYHLYVTNISASKLVDEDIDQLYRLRWEVETFYKVGKTGLGLDEITSSKPHIVRTFIKAALVRASVAMQARAEAQAKLPAGRWINHMQWVQVWRAALPVLLDGILGLLQSEVAMTWERLARLAVDPHRQRVPTRHWIQFVAPAKTTI